MKLSVSQEQTYRKCRRKWFYRYNLGYKQIVEPKWLEDGKTYEEMMYIFHKRGYESAKQFIHLKEPDKFKKLDMEFILNKLKEQDEKERLEFVPIAGKPGYQFEFEIPFTIPGFTDNEITAHGFFDEVVKLKSGIAVFEGKTTVEPIEYVSEYWKKLDMDAQVSCYAWAASQCLGYSINHVLYHVIRKPNFAKTHKVKGEDVAYTEEEYVERMALDKKTYVSRRLVHVSEERKRLWALEHVKSHDEILKDLEQCEILEFCGYEKELQFKRNFAECDAYGGCPYREACSLKKDISEIEYLKKREEK